MDVDGPHSQNPGCFWHTPIPVFLVFLLLSLSCGFVEAPGAEGETLGFGNCLLCSPNVHLNN